MDQDHFVKVFDILDVGFRNWTFAAHGLIFVAVGVGLVLFPTVVRKLDIPFIDFGPTRYVVLGAIFLVFSILWTAVAFSMTYSPYLRHKALVQDGGCRIVQGRVERFVPPNPTQRDESFVVNGVTFRYSDFAFNDGFNNTSAHGGPIGADQYVRICYDPAGNIILRLEIRDFTGPVKDYAQAPWLPNVDEQTAGELRRLQMPASVQWLGYPWLALALLDALVIWCLYLPYLRCFFPVGTVALSGRPISEDLPAEMKIKLRNSLIWWDRQAHQIWLRPRGFNFFQVPNAVAKLNVSPDNRAIVSYEVRLSPALPLFLVLMLWLIYEALSKQLNSMPWAPLAVFAAMIVVFGFFFVMMTRRRMETVVQEALQDIRRVPVGGGEAEDQGRGGASVRG